MKNGRSARTLEEAFGPYTSHHIEEPPRRMDWQDVVVVVSCSAAAITCLLLVFVGVIA